MKRLLYPVVTLLIILVGAGLLPVAAQQPTAGPRVLVDGLPVNFDMQPVIRQGTTLVPFRAIAEVLGINVNWEQTTKTVTATNNALKVRLQVGNQTAYCNQTPIVLAVAPIAPNGRVLIPLRFFSEAFSCQVTWDSSGTVNITSPPRGMMVIGFYALGDRQTSSWTDIFGQPYPETGKGNTDIVSEVALGWYSVDAQGELLTRSQTGWQRPVGWEKVLEASEKYNLKTEMVIHITNKGGTITSLLKDDTAVNQLVSSIAQEAQNYGGVNLDFEGLGLSETGSDLTAVREQFTRFVRLLSEALQADNKSLTLTLHPPNGAYKGYDYRALGALADRLVIMAYDYGSRPEPVGLVLEAVEMARAVVPADKLMLGISIPSENPASLVTKVAIAKRYNLQGIALWRLGLLSDAMWESLRSSITAH